MARKRYRPEEIAAKLRQVDVQVSQGQAMADAIRQIVNSDRLYLFINEHNKTAGYSITSSARASKVGETVRPSARAVLRLTVSSSLVGNSIGRSPGRAPLRIFRSAAARAPQAATRWPRRRGA